MRWPLLTALLTAVVMSACSTTAASTGRSKLQPGEAGSLVDGQLKKTLSELTRRVARLETEVALIQSTPRLELGPTEPDHESGCDEQTEDCD